MVSIASEAAASLSSLPPTLGDFASYGLTDISRRRPAPTILVVLLWFGYLKIEIQ